MPEVYEDEIEESPALITELVMHAGAPRFMLDTIDFQETLETLRAEALDLDEIVTLGEGFSFIGAFTIMDRMRVVSETIPATTYQMFLNQQLRVGFQARFGLGLNVSDELSLSAAAAAARSWILMDALGVAQTYAAAAVMQLSMSEAIRLGDLIRNFFGAGLEDGMSIALSASAIERGLRLLSDGVSVGQTVSPQMVLRVISDESVGVEDSHLLQMLFEGRASDTVRIDALHLNPDGSATTWCVNTRAGVVTEYTDYTFNSFAQMGRVYLGARDTGLYELAGDDDDGNPIIARMRGGFLQLNGSKMMGLKGAYIGLRGEGEFFLRLDAASGEVYTYRVLARDMATVKVNIGKGLRHRYIGYELISTGQDFDLESIEFVPMMANRRV